MQRWHSFQPETSRQRASRRLSLTCGTIEAGALADAALDVDFLKEAAAAGLKTLKGHRSVGGMRASIYNAMPEQGVRALVDFMAEFERTRG